MSVKVLVIDSGVDLRHPSFVGVNIKTYDFIDTNLKLSEGNDTYGHGTAIASIIAKKKNVEIVSVKLDDIENAVDEKQLVSLLKYIYANMQFDIINLSLGLNICEDEELFSLCEMFKRNNTVIVSAFDNLGSISFPAAFSNVIGVTSGGMCNKINQFEYVESAEINLAAKGGLQRVAWVNPQYLMVGGNSFACAHASAQIVDFINDGIVGFDNILKEFRNNAIKIWEEANPVGENSKPKIERAILFPFNKEMHSLIRFSHLLNFKIVGVYDCKFSANIGATTKRLMDDDVLDIKIGNINQVDWNEFDTIILGHTDEMLNVAGDKEIYKFIEEAKTKNKQFYSLDEVNVKRFDLNNVYYPIISKTKLPSNRFGKLYRISKPVVGVFGTSSKQGKFTLQLKLREQLIKDGYKVGQIGTEPHSLLFDFDDVFPIGYNSNVSIFDNEVVSYLNNRIYELCMSNDLILVGSQSGTVPYDVGNLAQFTISQMVFLQGTQPDTVILCINAFDDNAYVKRTIEYIEASVDCKVIALVLFPVTLNEDWRGIYGGTYKICYNEKRNLIEKFSKCYERNVYMLDDLSQIIELKETIIDFFSEKGE